MRISGRIARERVRDGRLGAQLHDDMSDDQGCHGPARQGLASSFSVLPIASCPSGCHPSCRAQSPLGSHQQGHLQDCLPRHLSQQAPSGLKPSSQQFIRVTGVEGSSEPHHSSFWLGSSVHAPHASCCRPVIRTTWEQANAHKMASACS